MKFSTISPNQGFTFSGRHTVVAARRAVSPLVQICSLIPVSAALIFLVASILLMALAGKEHAEQVSFANAMRAVPVKVELPRPLPSQESVDVAMAAFGVDLEANVNSPIFDGSLSDRGLTAGGTLDVRRSIWVGPAAFISWGVLGSTLGHEIEVHGQQSFLAILIMDGVADLRRGFSALVSAETAAASAKKESVEALWGTWRAERTAYLYEVSSADRYGLTSEEVGSIRQVMEYYYPAALQKQRGKASKK